MIMKYSCKMVAKCDNKQNINCSFCDKYPESIEHLFWNCQLIKTFWSNVNSVINKTCKYIHNFKFYKILVLLRADTQTEGDSVCDFIILLGKQYIYSCKVKNWKQIQACFQSILYRRYLIEKRKIQN